MFSASKEKQLINMFIVILFVIFPASGVAGVPAVSDITVTDVATRSFSVIWSASEPSTSSLLVYNDADGLVQTLGSVITSQPVNNGSAAIQHAAENNGVMKVRVTGLEPGTTYYFRTFTTSKSTSEMLPFPNTAPLPGVTTENRTVRTEIAGTDEIPFTNDLITLDCYLADGVTPAAGTLLVAAVDGCSYPVSAFVGDGIIIPLAYVDLNNLFDAVAHENAPLFGGEGLTLTQFMGSGGMATAAYVIPMNEQLGEMKPPEAIACDGDLDGDHDVDGLDLGILAEAFNTIPGDPNYNPDADIDASGAVDEGDLALFTDKFGQASCQ